MADWKSAKERDTNPAAIIKLKQSAEAEGLNSVVETIIPLKPTPGVTLMGTQPLPTAPLWPSPWPRNKSGIRLIITANSGATAGQIAELEVLPWNSVI